MPRALASPVLPHTPTSTKRARTLPKSVPRSVDRSRGSRRSLARWWRFRRTNGLRRRSRLDVCHPNLRLDQLLASRWPCGDPLRAGVRDGRLSDVHCATGARGRPGDTAPASVDKKVERMGPFVFAIAPVEWVPGDGPERSKGPDDEAEVSRRVDDHYSLLRQVPGRRLLRSAAT